jgi:hypothetical protein
LNNALSSENPEASASTAAGVPRLRSANMARYLSNNGSWVFVRSFWREEIWSGDMWSGFGAPESRPDVAGAGSIEVYVLHNHPHENQWGHFLSESLG